MSSSRITPDTLKGTLAWASADNNARQGTALSGTVEPGNYCAAVFDNGNVTAPVTYTVRVQRPGE